LPASYDASVLPDGRRLGAHLSVASGLATAVERAHTIGATAIQVFADNPTAWRRRPEPPVDAPAFRERLAARDIGPVAIHAPYLVNLAGPDEVFAERSIAVLIHDLRVAPAFGAAFLNVHIGSHGDTAPADGIARLADGIARVLGEVDDGPGSARLVLENSAGGGFTLGVDLDELAAIADALTARGVDPARVGFCLDTAHAWGAGIDLSEPEAIDAFLRGFDARVGLERLVMVHLNDSKVERGSRMDRHEHLGAGRIGERGLAAVLTHPGLARATYYLETPGMDEGYDAVNVGRAYDLAAGRPLAALPPEAMEVRGSRARSAPAEPEPTGAR
jgi:deoxyribonuclease-4